MLKSNHSQKQFSTSTFRIKQVSEINLKDKIRLDKPYVTWPEQMPRHFLQGLDS